MAKKPAPKDPSQEGPIEPNTTTETPAVETAATQEAAGGDDTGHVDEAPASESKMEGDEPPATETKAEETKAEPQSPPSKNQGPKAKHQPPQGQGPKPKFNGPKNPNQNGGRPNNNQPNRPFTPRPQAAPIINGINIRFQCSVDMNTQFFDYRANEELSDRFRDVLNVAPADFGSDKKSTWAVLPDSKEMTVEDQKKKAIEIYVDVALGHSNIENRDELAANVFFSEIMVADVETFRVAGKGSLHWGVIALSDAASAPRNPNDTRKYRSGDSYAHHHEWLSHEGTDKPGLRHGLLSQKEVEVPNQQVWIPIIGKGVVMMYRHVASIEKRPNYFVPQYEVIRTVIFKDNAGRFKTEAFASTVEPKNLVEIIEDQERIRAFRMNAFLENDLIAITDWDLGIKIRAKKPAPFIKGRPYQHQE